MAPIFTIPSAADTCRHDGLSHCLQCTWVYHGTELWGDPSLWRSWPSRHHRSNSSVVSAS